MAIDNASVRLFLAAALPEWLKDALESHHPPYRHEAVRFVPRENLHLTFHFIGNFPLTQVPDLEERLKKLAKDFPSFPLKLQEVAPGPSPGNPRLIWARFAPSPVFEALSLTLAKEMGGNAQPHPHPIPHVTLGRFRKDRPKPTHLPVEQNFDLPTVGINSISLWQSHLGQPQPRYVVLNTFALGPLGHEERSE